MVAVVRRVVVWAALVGAVVSRMDGEVVEDCWLLPTAGAP